MFSSLEVSCEILTRTKEHLSYTKRPNNPMEVDNSQIKSLMAIHNIFNNNQVDIENIEVIQVRGLIFLPSTGKKA